MKQQELLDLYNRLATAYGPQDWWPADGPLEVIVGAILTQRTTWVNAERAIGRLRDAHLLSLRRIDRARLDVVADAIRPAGCYHAKARKLKALATWVRDRHKGDLARFLGLSRQMLRSELLRIYGIGPETADAILVFAAGKPSFIVDAYTRRLFGRLGCLEGGESYDAVRERFAGALPEDAALLGEFHALIVCHGKTRCRPRPICAGCPLLSDCLLPVQAEGGLP